MSKFETFKPQPRDLWRTTDPNAFPPLIPYVRGLSYAEPCYGAGDLEDGLMDAAKCKWRSDIEPQVASAIKKNALDLTEVDITNCDCIITNPPFSFRMLQPLLEHLPTLRPTWMLLPADFMHNKQSRPYMDRCSHIVSIGRLFFHKAGEDPLVTKYASGTSNNCWYLFNAFTCDTIFKGWVSK